MISIDGKWIMEGLDRNDERRIKSSKELSDYIDRVGFLPFFKSNIEGFSVEELTAGDSWWSGNPAEDPWQWREVIACEGRIAYGKLFSGKAGFISRQWYPVFACYRRDGYDFDSRYEDGLASRKQKKLMDILEQSEGIPSYELKKYAGFSREGEKGFEGSMAALQMQTYVIVCGFHRKRNKKNEEYGWAVADYMLSEKLFGREHVRSAYSLGAGKAKEKLIEHLLSMFPSVSAEAAKKLIK